MMKTGFTAIQLHDYVELHVRANPDTERAEGIKQLESTIDAYRAGARCQCGDSIWIIGSARAGLGCFTCIAEQTNPDHDYEVDDLRGAAPVVDTTSRFVAQGGGRTPSKALAHLFDQTALGQVKCTRL